VASLLVAALAGAGNQLITTPAQVRPRGRGRPLGVEKGVWLLDFCRG
jgi:hypothetical protein